MDKTVRAVGLGCIILVIMVLCISLVATYRPPVGDQYQSVHAAATVPPMMGFNEQATVNQGDLEALDALPGIGEVLAGRIIDTKADIGEYRIPEDLLLVSGIGEKRLANMMEILSEELVLLK